MFKIEIEQYMYVVKLISRGTDDKRWSTEEYNDFDRSIGSIIIIFLNLV